MRTMRRKRIWRQRKPRLAIHRGYLDCLKWASARKTQTAVELMEARAWAQRPNRPVKVKRR